MMDIATWQKGKGEKMSIYVNADTLRKRMMLLQEHDGKYLLTHEVFNTIWNTPLADVRENVHGEWVLDDSVFGFPKWNCSKCEGEGRGDYLFCPNCGALMSEILKSYEIGKSLVDGIQAGINAGVQSPYELPAQERDCEHCAHRKDKGCEKWNCEFERRQ